MNEERLIKLLNLSTSSNDNEALSAIRAANAMLSKNCYKWEDVINVDYEEFDRPEYENNEYSEENDYMGKTAFSEENEKIRNMIIFCSLKCRSASDTRFTNGIAEYFNKNGTLTDKQVNVLDIIYNKLKNIK